MRQKTNEYKVLVRKPEGKRPHGRPRRRWKDNTDLDLIQDGSAQTGFICMTLGFCHDINEIYAIL